MGKLSFGFTGYLLAGGRLSFSPAFEKASLSGVQLGQH
jgi:hypothetical protein